MLLYYLVEYIQAILASGHQTIKVRVKQQETFYPSQSKIHSSFFAFSYLPFSDPILLQESEHQPSDFLRLCLDREMASI